MKQLWRCLAMSISFIFLSACSSVLFFAANVPALFGPAKRTADIAYGPHPRQRLDVYKPKTAVRRPVVIFWYGGSWQMGGKSNYRFVAEALAAHGFVAVLPDYRLYPAVKFPAFVDDGAATVAWVQRHATEFGGDPEHIVLMGHSAGAHMAAMLAFNHERLKKAGAKPEWIRGLVGLSGPYALDPNSDVLNTIFAAPYTMADWQPVRFVDAKAPPTLLLHGADDTVVYASHAEKLRDALKEAGVPVELELYPKRKHADTVAGFAWGAKRRVPSLEQTVRFIEKVTTEKRLAAKN